MLQGSVPQAPHALGCSPGLCSILTESQHDTCRHALAWNTCTWWLPRAQELFETPHPVWELFQMKSLTHPCIKTMFLRWEKERAGDLQGFLLQRSSTCATAITLPSCTCAPWLNSHFQGWRAAASPCQEARRNLPGSHLLSGFSLLAAMSTFLLFVIHSTHLLGVIMCPTLPWALGHRPGLCPHGIYSPLSSFPFPPLFLSLSIYSFLLLFLYFSIFMC